MQSGCVNVQPSSYYYYTVCSFRYFLTGSKVKLNTHNFAAVVTVLVLLATFERRIGQRHFTFTSHRVRASVVFSVKFVYFFKRG